VSLLPAGLPGLVDHLRIQAGQIGDGGFLSIPVWNIQKPFAFMISCHLAPRLRRVVFVGEPNVGQYHRP
jgi:hypothetical protein